MHPRGEPSGHDRARDRCQYAAPAAKQKLSRFKAASGNRGMSAGAHLTRNRIAVWATPKPCRGGNVATIVPSAPS